MHTIKSNQHWAYLIRKNFIEFASGRQNEQDFRTLDSYYRAKFYHAKAKGGR